MQPGNWLASNSALYQEQGIAFNPDWEIIFDQTNELNEEIDETKNILADEDDQFSEDEAEIPAGVTESMLTPPDFVYDKEMEHILNVAPEGGTRPLSVFKDKYSE